MASNVTLPEGFVLDHKSQEGLPEGFILDTGTTQPTPTEPSLINKLSQRVSNIGQQFVSHPEQKQYTPPVNPIHIAGQVAGGVGDVATSALKGLYQAVTPDYIQGIVQEGTKLGTPVGNVLNTVGQGINQAVQYGEKNYPETTQYIKDVANIASAIPAIKGATGLIKGASGLAKEGIDIFKNTTLQSATDTIANMPEVAKDNLIKIYDQKLNNVVNKGFAGTIGNKGKSVTQSVNEQAKRTAAVESIIKDPEVKFMTESGGISQIPKTVDETAQAIDMRKNNIWNNNIAPVLEATGNAGYKVPVTNSIDELDKIIGDRTLLGSPVIDQAQKFKDELLKVQTTGGFTVEEAQKFISDSNTALKTYFSKVNPELDTNLAMRANIAREMRKDIDDVAMKATGEGINSAKKEYGALLSIEEDMNKLKNKVARQSTNKNVPTYMDMATDWGMLHGGMQILQGASSTSFLPATIVKGINIYRKYMLNPDNRISKMFTDAEKFVNRKVMVQGTTPTPSYIPNQIEYKPQINLGMEDISGQPSEYTPPLLKPTTKAIGFDRTTTPINLGMLDESSIKSIKGVYSNPEFWNNNKDLTGLRLRIKNNQPIPLGEWNTLLQRIMMNRMGSNINPNIPLK